MMRIMAPDLPVLPPRAVLDAFGAAGDADLGTAEGAGPAEQAAQAGALRPLPGGQGSSVLAGPLVLKPHAPEHLAEAHWSAEVVEALAGRADGFRVARPVRARDGALFVEGWGATEFLDGELRGVGPADWPALIEAGLAYNEALRELARPEMLDRRTHRWALADRVAFGAPYPDPVPAARLLLETLLRQRRPCREPAQIIHGDLAGNVLFSPGRPPAVIDFSPYWRPADYALAVAAVDALLWYEAPLSVLELVAGRTGPDFADHLIRALIFRLVAHSEAVKAAGAAASAGADPEMERFDLVYDLVKRFQRGPLGSAGSRAFDAVLCDVDGVLRHWPSDEALESAHGLAPGAFAAVAYAPGRLLPAITGAVTDERWRESVAEGLVEEGHCASLAAARAVVAEWKGVRPSVDDDVLALLQLAREILPVVLVSNATSRLETDLKDLGLAEFVDQVVNTSRIGFAKPDPRVFAHAARQAGVPVERCLFVDDTRGHVEAARAAGMHAVHFHEAADLEEALRPLFPLLRRPA
jgi:putative hydrolase of the HAD superfamily